MSKSVVLCEGYHDRAFWAGWLERLGCHARVKEPDDKALAKAHFGFSSPANAFVRVVPCHGKRAALDEARRRIKSRAVDPFRRLVLSVDSDVEINAGDKTGFRPEDLEREVRSIESRVRRNEGGDIELDDGEASVSLVRWEAEETKARGTPNKQTLERLVCVAVVSAYAERAEAVDNWLESRPAKPDPTPKEYAWSYMAGWYAEFGCDAFYRAVWQDEAIAGELEARLRAAGAWRVAEALLE